MAIYFNRRCLFLLRLTQHIIMWLLSLSVVSSNIAATPTAIITSIAPLSYLVAEIVQDLDEEFDGSATLIQAQESIHETSMSLSKIEQCNKSAIIFWIGPHLEESLAPMLNRFSEKTVELGQCQTIRAWLQRTDSVLPCCQKKHLSENINDLAKDWHLWYSPMAAELMAIEIAQSLSKIFPKHQLKFAENLHHFLDQLHQELTRAHNIFKKRLFPPIGVSHYAYRHLFKTLHLPDAFEFSELNHACALSPKKFLAVLDTIRQRQIRIFLTEWSPSPVLLHLKKYTEIDIIVTDQRILETENPPKNYLNWFRKMIDLLDEIAIKT